MSGASTWPQFLAALVARALVNPFVARDLLCMSWAFRRRGWWRTPPFLPLPDPRYLEWRLHTAYGDDREVPPVDDVVRFARWRRRILRD
jgi:hypothetical protein